MSLGPSFASCVQSLAPVLECDGYMLDQLVAARAL
jgi:hypothetical protein